MPRTAHYVASTHWDREWYESFQGYRMRLVSLLDEALATMAADPSFRVFTMDGQVIPIVDYLEIRPERRAEIERLTHEGRLKLGPWYVMPDEWLVSGESLVRNLQLGVAEAERFGGASRAGFVCDMFGHIAQLPQLVAQMGGTAAFIWRGVHEKDHGGNVRWRGPDGSALDAYRFGQHGYCTYAFKVRLAHQLDTPFVVDDAAVERLTAFVLAEAKRCPHGPVLLFDGADNVEIEPRSSTLFARANAALAAHGIRIEHSDLDRYAAELAEARPALTREVVGELRETGRESLASDEHWLIAGTLSSRIHLKQRNAACEDELTLWAEPFSAFARELGGEWPASYLATAWRWLLENHPHDSMCGCSIDQVHQDMLYRFDQSLGIASRLTAQALRRIAVAAAPRDRPDGALTVTVFNHTAEDLDEPIDLDVPLPTTWPKRFQEFFGFEEKFAFRLRGPDGADIPYQLVGQSRDRVGIKRPRYKFPNPENRHVVHVTARVRVPAFGWTALVVAPVDGPTRYTGTLAVDHRTLDNGILRVAVNQNGTLDVLDHRTGTSYRQLLTFEQRADIGDGWFHGLAVNDQVFTSAAGSADVALVADGIGKATLRIHLVMRVPARFDGKEGRRSAELAPLAITSDVTLRAGADRIEVTATVDNTVRDHRLRVLLPTGIDGDTFVTDSAFAVVERAVALPDDNDARRELDVETRPQFTWTAIGDARGGLAVVSRGLPECTVRATADRPIALTLLRAFRRAVFANDNDGGQIQGTHVFRFAIVPFAGAIPTRGLSLLGQRIPAAMRSIDLLTEHLAVTVPTLPPSGSFLRLEGEVVASAVLADGDRLAVRVFNPSDAPTSARIALRAPLAAAEAVTLGGATDPSVSVGISAGAVEAVIGAQRIATLRIG